MPEPKIAFIDPAAVLGALTPMEVEAQVVDLDPSGPHQHDEPLEAPAALGFPIPELPKPEYHYTNHLDEITPYFEDPEQRTAGRLDALLDEVIEESTRVGLLGQRAWNELPTYKVPASERQRWNDEFLAYLRRLNGYRMTLAELDPSSTATESVYVGLVKRAQGAGPVPDCIMHMYFAQQIGILEEHASEMGAGFVGRTVDAIARVDAGIDQTIDDASAKLDDAKNAAQDLLDDFGAKLKKGLLVVGGIFVGTIVLITGSVVLVRRSRAKEIEE